MVVAGADLTARQKLAEFANLFSVPAVGGGLLNAAGEFEFDVVGTCQRGGVEVVQKHDQCHIAQNSL